MLASDTTASLRQVFAKCFKHAPRRILCLTLLMLVPSCLPFTFTSEQLDRLADRSGSAHLPAAAELSAILRDTAQLFNGRIQLAGSHGQGTALSKVSDYDIWIHTPQRLAIRERELLCRILTMKLEEAEFTMERRVQKRKAYRLYRLQKLGSPDCFDMDVVCVNMFRDCGFNDHDFPHFTRCKSREEARIKCEQLRCCRKSRNAVRVLKALCIHERKGRLQSLPGFLLSILALRIASSCTCETSLELFEQMFDVLFCDRIDGFEYWRSPDGGLAERLRSDLSADFSQLEQNRPGEHRQRWCRALERAIHALNKLFGILNRGDFDALRLHPVLGAQADLLE